MTTHKAVDKPDQESVFRIPTGTLLILIGMIVTGASGFGALETQVLSKADNTEVVVLKAELTQTQSDHKAIFEKLNELTKEVSELRRELSNETVEQRLLHKNKQ